ncbi:MAG: hypothetical protein WCB68_13370 [Pyrinomonadaceae bacterium]
MAAATTTNNLRHDPRKLVGCLFNRAKKWWIASLLCKVGSIAVGAINVLIFPDVKSGAVAVFLIYVFSEIATWRSDSFKGTAESVLRKLDFKDAFGWDISLADMADLVMNCPASIRRIIPPPEDSDNYFASAENVGATRAIENLQESSWWSKHVAKRMGHLCLAATIALVLFSIVVLLISIDTVRDFDRLSSIGRVVTSALMLIFSLGLLRLTMGYYGFAKKAEQADQLTLKLFSAGCDQLEAVKAWHEYQVARAASPPLPSWLWKWMNKDMNEAWEQYRRRQPAHCKEIKDS